VASDRTGAFTVTWSSIGNVSGRRYDASGAALGGAFPVNSFVTGTQSFSTVAVDASANVVAAWESTGQDGSGDGVAARRFDCDGQALGPDFLVNTYTAGSQGRPSIAAAAGDFMVAWIGRAQDGDGDGIYAQRFHGQPACGRFHAVAPCRLVDTRTPPPTPLAANTTRTFQITGSCGIPADARAVALNVTAVAPTEFGNLRVYPAGGSAPLASAINFAQDRTRANNVVASLGANGQINVQCDMPAGSSGRTHLVVDTTGYFR
jgi:hypothetical protein